MKELELGKLGAVKLRLSRAGLEIVGKKSNIGKNRQAFDYELEKLKIVTVIKFSIQLPDHPQRPLLVNL